MSASYEGFAPFLAGIDPPLDFERGRPETFADGIAALVALSDEERHRLGSELRDRVGRQHSVETWADAILGLLEP